MQIIMLNALDSRGVFHEKLVYSFDEGDIQVRKRIYEAHEEENPNGRPISIEGFEIQVEGETFFCSTYQTVMN